MLINVLFEHDTNGHPHGCSHIRLLRPLSHPTLNGRMRIIPSTELCTEQADVVILERWWNSSLNYSAAKQLVDRIKARGSTLIYTLDDNLLDIDIDEEGKTISDDLKMATRTFIREAYGVIVSTPSLKRRLERLNSNIQVIPNALDERLFFDGEDVNNNSARFLTRQPSCKVITIGYMGTMSHASDLKILIEPLRRIFSKYGKNVRFELIGGTTDSNFTRCLAEDNIRVLHPGSAVHYQSFIPWFKETVRWDIGVAPLTERPFNQYKSDIKFLDYGIYGIPGIFSNLGPYPDTVCDHHTGLLVENTPDAWFSALSTLILEPELRAHIGANAATYVKQSRLLETKAIDWFNAIEKILSFPKA